MPDYTILLIDYEPRSIERSRRPLVAAGYRVEVATDGLAGLEAFERVAPDLVLVEAMIPKKHGFEVCQEIKKNARGKRTPVLITTAVYKGRKYRSQALHLYGCDEYLEKPIPDEQLVTICARFLGDDDVAARLAPPPAQEPASAGPAAEPASRAVAGAPDAEQEILARLDAILPGAERETPAVDATRASEPPRAEVAPKHVISIDEARERKKHRKGGHGRSGGGRRGSGAAASPEPHAAPAVTAPLPAQQPVAQAAPSPQAETRLMPDPLPLAQDGTHATLPGWVWLLAAAGLGGVLLLLWRML